MNEADALKLAKEAYASSTSFVDANYRKQWDTNLRLNMGKHPTGSKYLSEAYKYRSKIFRPKTRSAGRRLEAAAAAAFFSNLDVVNVEAANSKSKEAEMGAAVRKAVLQHRLTKTIPWFVLVMGAVQDAYTMNVIASYQDWKYREQSHKVPRLDEEGVAMVDEVSHEPIFDEVIEVIEDEPSIELIAVENLRISPAAKWYDPIRTSPYVIELMPMYVCDVRDMMQLEDPKTGAPAWKTLTEEQLRSATAQAHDPTRQTREGNREDSQAPSAAALEEYEIVWIHRNIMRRGGQDWVYYTAGVEHMLSTPKPLREVYRHCRKPGDRPYVMGVAQIQTHKLYGAGPTEMGEPLQREINEVVNSRLDNVKLVLNKRYKAKRGAQVDLRSLVRNAAGSVTMVTNMDDVEPIEFTDVTASSYQEQDRLSIEHDELIGNFSQSSVMSNRKLNETVGGMAMISGSSNQMTEYTIRTLTETWVEPVLRQVSAMEAAYETDETLLALVGESAGLPDGMPATDDMLNEDISLTVNVGIGATDPTMRLNKLLAGVNAAIATLAQPLPGIDTTEVLKEVFGAIGYRDGGRFIAQQEDPRQALEQMKAELEKCQAELQQCQAQLQQADLKLTDKTQERQIKAARAEQAMQQSDEEHQLSMTQDMRDFMQTMLQGQAEFAQEMRQERAQGQAKIEQMLAEGAQRREMARRRDQAKPRPQ